MNEQTTETATERRPLSDIREGDRVWLSSGHGNSRAEIQTVKRLTRTQIVLDRRFSDRYQRGTLNHWGEGSYRRIGGGMWCPEITAIATPEECAKWDAQQAKKQADDEASNRRREEAETRRRELASLLDGSPAFYGIGYAGADTSSSKFNVSLHLTEDGVRRLAEYLKSNPA